MQMRLIQRFLIAATIVATGASTGAQGRAGGERTDAPPEVLRVAVVNTPDVLLAALLPAFERQTGYDVRLEITEGVYDIARTGGADMVIAHFGHPGTEPFMSDGLGRWPRPVFANQAVLAGPSSDPAGIRGMVDAVEAFRRIVERGGEFVVNNAVTERYLAEVLWQAIGRPAKTGWWVDLGLRDQAAIEFASRRGAYTLWGVVPFVRLLEQRPLQMDALVLGDPILQRVMVAIVVNSDRIAGVNEERARALQRYLIEPSTQARIRRFRHHGLQSQTWWPAGRHNPGSELAGF